MSPLCNRASARCPSTDQLLGLGEGGARGSAATTAGYVNRVQSYLVLAEHISLSDAVQQGVGDLASGAGHHNADWFSLGRARAHTHTHRRTQGGFVLTNTAWIF